MNRPEYVETDQYRAVQWAPDGNPGNGIPGLVCLLLADGDTTFGYGYGPGTTMLFGHSGGDVALNARQWVVRWNDGRVEAVDALPVAGSAPQ